MDELINAQMRHMESLKHKLGSSLPREDAIEVIDIAIEGLKAMDQRNANRERVAELEKVCEKVRKSLLDIDKHNYQTNHIVKSRNWLSAVLKKD